MSKVSFRIPTIKEPPSEVYENIYRWRNDVVRILNQLVDSVNSVGSYLS